MRRAGLIRERITATVIRMTTDWSLAMLWGQLQAPSEPLSLCLMTTVSGNATINFYG